MCLESFKETDTLENFLRLHSREKPYICEECLETFNEIDTWENFSRLHSGEKPYNCKVCLETDTLENCLDYTAGRNHITMKYVWITFNETLTLFKNFLDYTAGRNHTTVKYLFKTFNETDNLGYTAKGRNYF